MSLNKNLSCAIEHWLEDVVCDGFELQYHTFRDVTEMIDKLEELEVSSMVDFYRKALENHKDECKQ